MLSEAEKNRLWLKAGLENDLIFGLVMGQPRICKLFLEALLPELKLMEITVNTQQDITNYYGAKGVRLDVFVTDDKGRIYDIEIQVRDEHNLPKRTKYYHSMMTNRMLERGDNYQKITATYVIFLCLFDPLQNKAALAHFEMLNVENPSEKLNDGTHTIILNAKADLSKLNKNLQGLLQILGGQAANDSELSQEVLEALKGVKGDMEVKERFGVSFEDVYADAKEEGREEGKEEGQKENMRVMILNKESLGFTREQLINAIMKSLNYSEAEAQELYDELAKK